MGKYQLDNKGKVAVTKFHEKTRLPNLIKRSMLKKVRAEYLKKKQKQKDE